MRGASESFGIAAAKPRGTRSSRTADCDKSSDSSCATRSRSPACVARSRHNSARSSATVSLAAVNALGREVSRCAVHESAGRTHPPSASEESDLESLAEPASVS